MSGAGFKRPRKNVRSGPARSRATAKPAFEKPVFDKPGLECRQAATRLLSAVVDAFTPLDALTDNEHGHPQYLALDGRDRALCRAIVITALRYRCTILALLESRLDRPLPANARSLLALLHVGAAQILFLDVPDSAAVDLAVTQATSDPRSARFSGLVNGVLRNLARRKERALPAALAELDDAPEWFLKRLRASYGEKVAAEILQAMRQEAAMDLSVKSDPEGWAAKLGGTVLPNGSVRLQKIDIAVPDMPGYADGEWWVQDAAASLPPRLLGNVKGLRVADLCAAPGGKTACLAAAGANVTAVDQSGNRLKRLRQNLERLQLSAEVVEQDILKWLPEQKFDAILIDAPCSSTGTIRRHPDVLWSKTAEDITKLAHLQRRLLEKCFDLVEPGSPVVFANCSLDHEEGEDLVRAFLAARPDVEIDPIKPDELPGAAHFVTEEGWLRTTPKVDDTEGQRLTGVDGFFAVRLRQIKR